MHVSATGLHHVVDMPTSFPEPVILSFRWTRVNKGSGERIAGNILGAIFTPESSKNKNGMFANAKIKEIKDLYVVRGIKSIRSTQTALYTMKENVRNFLYLNWGEGNT